MEAQDGRVRERRFEEGVELITLEGKVALVTGAAGGIGAEISRLFAECGASVVLADVQEERGQMFVIDGGCLAK